MKMEVNMFPRPRRQIAVVIRKNGEQFIPKFPVELEAGDQLIITKELMGSEVPEGERWIVTGYTENGPIIQPPDSYRHEAKK